MVMLILCILLFATAFLIIDRREKVYDITHTGDNDNYVPLTGDKFDDEFADSVMT